MLSFFLVAIISLACPDIVHAVSLSIDNPLVSGLEISVNASLSASTNYYLQGVMRSQSSSKYFGETQNNGGSWIDYVSSPDKEYITSNFFVTDVKEATWSGVLKLRFKVDDPSYLGPGPYDLKIRRYTGNSSSSAGESNTLVVDLNQALPTPQPQPTADPPREDTPSPQPTADPPRADTPPPKPTVKSSPLLSPSPDLINIPDGTVAGATTQIDLSGFGTATYSPDLQHDELDGLSTKPTLNHARVKTASIVGTGLILISVSGYVGYRKYRALLKP